jgi:hypothetical protein
MKTVIIGSCTNVSSSWQPRCCAAERSQSPSQTRATQVMWSIPRCRNSVWPTRRVLVNLLARGKIPSWSVVSAVLPRSSRGVHRVALSSRSELVEDVDLDDAIAALNSLAENQNVPNFLTNHRLVAGFASTAKIAVIHFVSESNSVVRTTSRDVAFVAPVQLRTDARSIRGSLGARTRGHPGDGPDVRAQ